MSDLNTRFNAIVANAPKVKKVIGRTADGRVLVIEVPHFGFAEKAEAAE